MNLSPSDIEISIVRSLKQILQVELSPHLGDEVRNNITGTACLFVTPEEAENYNVVDTVSETWSHLTPAFGTFNAVAFLILLADIAKTVHEKCVRTTAPGGELLVPDEINFKYKRGQVLEVTLKRKFLRRK